MKLGWQGESDKLGKVEKGCWDAERVRRREIAGERNKDEENGMAAPTTFLWVYTCSEFLK